MGFRLAEMFVEFGTKGAKEAKAEVSSFQDKLAGVAKAATGAVAAIAAIGVAGIASSTQGEQLGETFGEFARVVGSVALPFLNLMNNVMREFTERLAGSAGMEKLQASFEKIAEAAMPLAEKMMPILITAIEGWADLMTDVIVPVFEWLSGILEKIATGFLPAIIRHLEAMLTPLEKLGLLKLDHSFADDVVAGKIGGTEAKGKGGFQRLTSGGGGMESITSAYTRLQQALNKKDAGPEWPRMQYESSKQTVAQLERANGLLDSRLVSAVGR